MPRSYRKKTSTASTIPIALVVLVWAGFLAFPKKLWALVHPETEGGQNEVLAFPSDKPMLWNESDRRQIEIDVYGGPAFANSGGFGLGAEVDIEDLRATKEGLGIDWQGSFGGGYYFGGPHNYGAGAQQAEGQLLGGIALALGYYGQKGMRNGVSFHAFLEGLALNATLIGNIEQMVSFAPSFQVGLHGRKRETNATWMAQGVLGVNWSYVNGQLEKLSSSGSTIHSFFDPYFGLEASMDAPVWNLFFLRCSLVVSDTLDTIWLQGRNQLRHILQGNFNLFVKVGPTLYFGPAFYYTNQQWTANPVTQVYDRAVAQYSVGLLLGGALSGL